MVGYNLIHSNCKRLREFILIILEIGHSTFDHIINRKVTVIFAIAGAFWLITVVLLDIIFLHFQSISIVESLTKKQILAEMTFWN